MTALAFFVVLVDLAFVVGCLFIPRSGLEALAALYVLGPLAALHLLAGGAAGVVELRKRQWKFPVYFVLASCLMLAMAASWSRLQPTYRPLNEALVLNSRLLATRLVEFKDQRLLAIRRVNEQRQSPSHASLCSTLSYPVDVDAVSSALADSPDLSRPCALIRGRASPPLVALLGENHVPWARDKPAQKDARLADLRSAVAHLLKAGAHPNVRDDQGDTPLHWAMRYDDKSLVSLLLDGGACVYLPNDQGQTVSQSRSYAGLGPMLKAAAEDPQMALNCPEIFQHADRGATKELTDSDSHLWTRGLLRAVKTGNIEQLTDRLAKGADPNGRDDQGQAPLHLATSCRTDSAAMIEILVRAGARLDSRDRKGYTPLVAAARNHCAKIVGVLLEKGADPTLAVADGATAMHWVARWQADALERVIDPLMAAGAQIDAKDRLGRTPLMMTAFAPNTGDEALQVLLSRAAAPDAADEQGNTLLHLVAADSSREERTASVSALIKHGAKLDLRNAQQRTPLMLAVERKKRGIAKLLLDAGASPDVTSPRGTPLLHSVISCEPEKLALLELLIASRANVDLPNATGLTALHRALMSHLHVACNAPLERLLRAGAAPNIRDSNGTAPLHNLAQWERKDPAEALGLMRAAGAAVDIRDPQGMTPLLRAARFGTSSSVMERLLKAGADPSATNRRGNTLLHCVAMNTHPSSAVAIHVALGAFNDGNARNASGKTALELARQVGNQAVAQALAR